MFIDEKCENLKVVVDGGVLTRNINKKKKPVVLQAYNKRIDIHSVTNVNSEIASLISMWNIVNQLGKQDFSYGLILFVDRN